MLLALRNIAVFGYFWFRTSCIGYVNCESATEMDRIRLLEKKLSLFKEVAIFSIIGFKIGVVATEKYRSFRTFLV